MIKQYPAYKSSSVEWAPKIPKHWDIVPGMGMFEEQKTKNVESSEKNLLSLSYGKIVRKDIKSNLGLLPESFEAYQIVESGNIVLRLTDLQNDKRSLRVGLVQERGIITSAYLGLIPKKALPRYAYYLLHSYDLCKVFYTMGGGVRQSIGFSEFRRLPCLVPPLSEQCKISDYLDRTTQSIDALIAAKKRLLELLAEKRRSMITQAVTRGLTADVPMKDSTIEYLGEVPKHWNIRPLKYLSSFISGATPDKGNKEYWDGTVPWISPKDMKKEYLSTSSELITNLALEETGIKLIEPPAILVVVRGMILLHSFPVAISTSSTTINQDMKALRCRHDILPDFLARQLTARRDEILTMTRESGHGTKAMETTLLESLNIVIPPLKEQKAITQYIDKKSIQIDLLVDSAKKMIALLQERRTSLISAAVTGQLQIPD